MRTSVRNTFVLCGAVCLLLACGAARAELCGKCKGMMYTADVGTCAECGGPTTSGAFKLCPKCSAKLQQCEHCRGALTAANTVARPDIAVAAPDLRLGEDANATHKTVSVGQVLVVQLPGNPTTGYSWAVTKCDAGSVEQVGKAAYEQDPSGRGREGAGGVFTFRFRALKAGATVLTLAYRRPWEKDKAPEKTFTVTLTVAEAGK